MQQPLELDAPPFRVAPQRRAKRRRDGSSVRWTSFGAEPMDRFRRRSAGMASSRAMR